MIENRSFVGLATLISSMFMSTLQPNAPKQKDTQTKCQSTNSYKAIVFDLGDVFVSYSRTTQLKVFIPIILQNPALVWHIASLGNAKKAYFDLLSQIPSNAQYHVYTKGSPLPKICTEWMCGTKKLEDIHAVVTQHINQSTHPDCIKVLFHTITQSMFNPDWLAGAQSAHPDMMQLALDLKKAGYKIYLCSNWDPQSFDLVYKKHQAFFEQFDGLMISGNEGIAKPHANIFEKICAKYQIQPNECVFIDDEEHNVVAAQQVGMRGIVHSDTQQTKQQLQELNVISK